METDLKGEIELVKLRETLAKEIILKGIQGKQNGLICFDDNREIFISGAARVIAWTALEKRIQLGSYSYLELSGIGEDGFKEILRSIPIHDVTQDYMNMGVNYSGGARDYLAISTRDNVVSFSWLPSSESTGDTRLARYILIAQVPSKVVTDLTHRLAETKSNMAYDLLLRSLYPNSLVPLSDGEIIKAIKTEGPELLRLVRPQMIKQYEFGLSNPGELVEFVQSNSVLKRMKPCEEVVIKIV